MNENCPSKYNKGLFWFAVLTAVVTFLLIGLGGLVTSHEAGMSVPDWPTSYGYNMFALPIRFWHGGAFFEHTHRLLASTVGFLTTVLAIWLWWKDSRRWMHQLGWLAFFLVVAQGVLGGLRVRLNMNHLGIFHGALAQFFLVVVCAIAMFTSRWWLNLTAEKAQPVARGLRSHVLYVTILIFIQLLIGATMRHQHAGLAISDFPLAYGKLWPDTSSAAIEHYNAMRTEMNGENPITAFQVVLQMIHRFTALILLLGIAAAAPLARKRLGAGDALTKLAWVWLGLVLAQVCLGAATIWYKKAADVATAHVMVGALLLVAGALWWLAAKRRTSLTEIAPAAQNRVN